MGRVDKTLIFVVAAMVFFVLIHQPLLALLAGFLGVVFLATSGDRYVSFGDVEVPKAGDYPKWDFWKGVLKENAEMFGEWSKKVLHTEVGFKRIGDTMKKLVYNEGGGDTDIYMFGPYAMVLPKSFAKDMHKLSHLSLYMNAISYIIQRKRELIQAYNQTSDPNMKEIIMNEIKAIEDLEKKLAEQMKNQT